LQRQVASLKAISLTGKKPIKKCTSDQVINL